MPRGQKPTKKKRQEKHIGGYHLVFLPANQAWGIFYGMQRDPSTWSRIAGPGKYEDMTYEFDRIMSPYAGEAYRRRRRTRWEETPTGQRELAYQRAKKERDEFLAAYDLVELVETDPKTGEKRRLIPDGLFETVKSYHVGSHPYHGDLYESVVRSTRDGTLYLQQPGVFGFVYTKLVPKGGAAEEATRQTLSKFDPATVPEGTIIWLKGSTSETISPFLDELAKRGLSLYYAGPRDRYRVGKYDPSAAENPAAVFPQFIHVSKNVMVTNINRPKHPWTVRYEVTAFGSFVEKREKHFHTKKEAMIFANAAVRGREAAEEASIPTKRQLQIIEAFRAGKSLGKRGDPISTTETTIYSYQMPIAQRNPDGSIWIESVNAAPSATTRNHIYGLMRTFTPAELAGTRAAEEVRAERRDWIAAIERAGGSVRFTEQASPRPPWGAFVTVMDHQVFGEGHTREAAVRDAIKDLPFRVRQKFGGVDPVMLRPAAENPVPETGDYAWQRFDQWFKTQGHWIYRDRDHAMRTWVEIGIQGLPDPPEWVRRAVKAKFGSEVLATEANEADAADYPDMHAAVVGAQRQFNASHILHVSGDTASVYTYTARGYTKRDLFRKGGGFHWELQGTTVTDLPKGATLIWQWEESAVPMAAEQGPYWTVVIPYQEKFAGMPWMPTDPSGPFSTLTRGAFATKEEAKQWAKRNLPRGAKVKISQRGGSTGLLEAEEEEEADPRYFSRQNQRLAHVDDVFFEGKWIGWVKGPFKGARRADFYEWEIPPSSDPWVPGRFGESRNRRSAFNALVRAHKARLAGGGTHGTRENPTEAHDFDSPRAAIEHARTEGATHVDFKGTRTKPTVYGPGWKLTLYKHRDRFHWGKPLKGPKKIPRGAIELSGITVVRPRAPSGYTAPELLPPSMQPPPAQVLPVPTIEHAAPAVLQENPVDLKDAVPWVKVSRDPERYKAAVEQARKIGPIDDPRKVYELLSPALIKEDQEVLCVVLLDVRQQCRGVAEIHRGARSRVSTSVLDVMRVVVASGAEGFVMVHNHPSGTATPSKADGELTKAVREATTPFAADVTFCDHVVIGVGQCYSFAEKKLIKMKK